MEAILQVKSFRAPRGSGDAWNCGRNQFPLSSQKEERALGGDRTLLPVWFFAFSPREHNHGIVGCSMSDMLCSLQFLFELRADHEPGSAGVPPARSRGSLRFMERHHFTDVAAADIGQCHFKNPNGVPSFSPGLLAKRATLGHRQINLLFWSFAPVGRRMAKKGKKCNRSPNQ